MPNVMRNLRYSLRQLVKAPSFSIAVIVSLAFGIGGTVAVFSLADAVLLRPLQFGNESRACRSGKGGLASAWRTTPQPQGNFADWKTRNHVFDELGAVGNTILSITGDGRPEQVEGNQLTANLLPILGVKPLLGRNFRPEEDQLGSSHVALISASLWQTRYGSDPGILPSPW
jgi:putative ABC transport system permease protein